MIIVLYEVSVLGMGRNNKASRTGIYHYIRNLAKALAKEGQVKVIPVCLSYAHLSLATQECLEHGLDISLLTQQQSRLAAILKYPISLSTSLATKLGNRKTNKFFITIYAAKALLAFNAKLTSAVQSRFRERTIDNIGKVYNFHAGPCVLHETYRDHGFTHARIKSLPDTPRCITIYDTIPIKFPDYFSPEASLEFESFINKLTVCDQIIAISDCTKNDLLDAIRLKPKRPVVVTPLAVDTRFKPVRPSEWSPQAVQLLQQFDLLKSPFILSVATLEPRKNIPNLLKAFSVAKPSLPYGTKLVLVGTKGWEQTDLDKLAESLDIESSIVFTGYLEDESLPSLLSAASVFCYPSLYEGFGLPVLEAMSCGCPVVTSNTSSLGEFFSTSSISVDPTNIQEIATAIITILNNPGLADELRASGFKQSSTLTWSNLAKITISAYKQAISPLACWTA